MWAARKKDSLLALSSCCPPSVRVALPSTPLHTYQFPGLGTNLSNLLQKITAPAHSAHPVQGQHIQHLLHRLLLEPEFRQETKGQGGESCLLGAGPPICTGFLEPRRLGTRWRAPTLADAPCSQQREHSLLAGFRPFPSQHLPGVCFLDLHPVPSAAYLGSVSHPTRAQGSLF